MIRANDSDPSKDRRHDDPEHFFLSTIRPSISHEAICFVVVASRPLDQANQATHRAICQLSTLLPSFSLTARYRRLSSPLLPAPNLSRLRR
ncbi:hypothetical protein ACLOJK_036752 [Asimina triloba]